MSVYLLDDGYIFLFYKEAKKEALEKELYTAIFQKFESTLQQNQVPLEELLQYAFNWCVERLVTILNNHTELRFYQALFLLHEFSCQFTINQPKKTPIPEMDAQDYALYRRTLKLCMEHACELNLSAANAFSVSYLNEIDDIAECMLYWGAQAYNFFYQLAEEKMHKGTITFKRENDAVFFRRNSYIHFKQLEMSGDNEASSLLVADQNCFSDFIVALENCLGIKYDDIRSVIWMIHDHNKHVGGQLVLCNWTLFPQILQEVSGVSYDKGVVFFRGLTLDWENKLSTKEAIYKSDSLYRSLYRPMLIWTVDNKPMTLLGEGAFEHAILTLCINSFGWGKYPKEWGNECFAKFVSSKKNENGKRLEDAIETILINNDILYDRNVKFLRKWNNMNLDINGKPGEIDFLFLYEGKIYVADSKHHLERFDPNQFRNDHSNFERIYNAKLSPKVDFFINHINAIEEHFQVKLNDTSFKLTNKNRDAVEGIFIINLPTYPMMLNEYRIITLFGLLQLIGKGPIKASKCQ